MNVYMTEEEQVEVIKKWWNTYGSTLITFVMIFALSYAGLRWWQAREGKINQQASIAYQQLLANEADKDTAGVTALANTILSQHASSPYADLALLIQARDAVAAKKYSDAEAFFDKLILQSKNNLVKQVAKIRAARLLLAEKKYQKALEMVNRVDNKNFQPLASEVRGDIFLAQGNKAKARQAYVSAIQAMPNNAAVKPILQMKLDDLPQSDRQVKEANAGAHA